MKLPELVYQDESRNNRSCRVGDRDADPYAKCSEPSGKNQQAGNEEQHLPGERKEDRLLRHPDGKGKSLSPPSGNQQSERPQRRYANRTPPPRSAPDRS